MVESVEFRLVAAVLNGSYTERRVHHATQSPCWVTEHGRILPEDPVCDGLCLELAVEAVTSFEKRRRRRPRLGELTPARAFKLAASLTGQVRREWDAAAGRYVRPERLDPDNPDFEHPTKGAPQWWRNALPDYRSRRRAYAMVRRARTNDPLSGARWPYLRWADEDGLSERDEAALVQWITEALRAVKPAFVERNLDDPFSRARSFAPLQRESVDSGDMTSLIDTLVDQSLERGA